MYMLRNIHKGRGQGSHKQDSQKENRWWCCPTEQIPNVDLVRWLPQPQRNGCHGHSYGSQNPPGRREHYPFHLWIAPSGTTPSGPMARRKITSVDVWKPSAAMHEWMLAETRIDSGRTMWQRLKSQYVYVYINVYIYRVIIVMYIVCIYIYMYILFWSFPIINNH